METQMLIINFMIQDVNKVWLQTLFTTYHDYYLCLSYFQAAHINEDNSDINTDRYNDKYEH